MKQFLITFIAGLMIPASLLSSAIKAWEKESPSGYEDLLQIETQIATTLDRTKQAVVSIETSDGAGSGVIVSADGLVLTAAHVIGERGKKLTVTLHDGKKFSALSLGGSVFSDAGMLRMDTNKTFGFASLAEVKESKLGDWCYALGHPNGFNESRGQVLRVGRIIGKQDETMQTDCRLLGGDSGGPLFNLKGQVIGIHSRISQLPDENFHIPTETFLSNWDFFMNEEFLSDKKLADGGFLGVASSWTKDGLTILAIVPQSPAEKYGLQKGDLLISIDGIALDSREKLAIYVATKLPGDSVVIEFQRDERTMSVKAPLISRNQKE